MKLSSLLTALFVAAALSCAGPDGIPPDVARRSVADAQTAWEDALETVEDMRFGYPAEAWSIRAHIYDAMGRMGRMGQLSAVSWPGNPVSRMNWFMASVGLPVEVGEFSPLTATVAAAVVELRDLLAEEQPTGTDAAVTDMLRDRVRRAERLIERLEVWRPGASPDYLPMSLPPSLAPLTDDVRSKDSERLNQILGEFVQERLAAFESRVVEATAQILAAEDELILRAMGLDAALVREEALGLQRVEQAEARLEAARTALQHARGPEGLTALAATGSITVDISTLVFADLAMDLNGRRLEFMDQVEPSIQQALVAHRELPREQVMVGALGFSQYHHRWLVAGGAEGAGEPGPLAESKAAWAQVEGHARGLLRDGGVHMMEVSVGNEAAAAGERYLEQMSTDRSAIAAARLNWQQSRAATLATIESMRLRHIALLKAERFHADALAQVARARQREGG